MRLLFVAILIVLLLIILWHGFNFARPLRDVARAERFDQPIYFYDELGPTRPYDISNPVYRKWDKPFDQLTPGERIQYILDTYFSLRSGEADPEVVTQRENAYISSLPLNGTTLPNGSPCADDYSDCAKWAANNECIINPEWMLKNCKSSCKSCQLTKEQRNNITAIYNQRDPPNCVDHDGAAYPGAFPYLDEMYDYDKSVFGISAPERLATVQQLGF